MTYTQLRIAFPLPEPEVKWLREQREAMATEEIEALVAITKEPDWSYPSDED